MAKKILFLFILISFIGATQTSHFLTNEEKAHLFHVVKKSPVLDRNIGIYFSYKGDLKKEKDSTVDYLFVENEIKKEPSLLKVQMAELSNASPGILAELSVKMSLWHLYNELKYSLENEEQNNPLIQSFFDEIINNSPSDLLIERKDEVLLSKKALEAIHPNITMNDRIDIVSKLGMSLDDQKKFLDVVTKAIQNYTNKKALDIYKMIGGEYPNYQNLMLAAGDGSGTSGLLGEKEVIERDISKKEKEEQKEKQNKGIGLYTYELKLQNKDDKEQVVPSKEPFIDFRTIPNKITNIHLSVWGFNYSTQTTVVINKGEKTYLLYGSKHTGELSPDTASKGKTYASLLGELNEKVDSKNTEVFGAKGLEYKVEDFKMQREEVLLQIKKAEYKESSLRVVGKKDKKRKTKYKGEHKESAIYTQFDKDQNKIKKKGSELSRLHARLNWLNQKIEEFEEEFQFQKTNLDRMQLRAEKMKKNLGVNKINYQIKDHVIYEFEDGATFNMKTQDFKFPPTETVEDYRIQLLAVPLSAMSDYADEIQLNISITEDQKEDEFDEPIAFSLNDVFRSNDFRLKQLNIDAESDYLISKYLRYLASEKLLLEPTVKASGVGFFSEGSIKSVSNQVTGEIESYSGSTKEEKALVKQSSKYKSLRTSQVFMRIDKKKMYLDVNSYTDPVKSSISKKYTKLKNLKKRNDKLTDNEILSALRSMKIYKLLIEKMKKEADSIFKDDQKLAKKIKGQLDEAYKQTFISINGMNVSLSELKGYVK